MLSTPVMEAERSDWIVQCFTSLPTHYRLYWRRFLQIKRPNQQYQSTEGKVPTIVSAEVKMRMLSQLQWPTRHMWYLELSVMSAQLVQKMCIELVERSLSETKLKDDVDGLALRPWLLRCQMQQLLECIHVILDTGNNALLMRTSAVVETSKLKKN